MMEMMSTERVWYIWIYTVTFTLIGSHYVETAGQYELMHALFDSYDPGLRPSLDGMGSQTVITLNPALYTIIDLNENIQELTYSHWYRMEWYDPTLKWNPANYSGIDVLKVPSRMVWMPDITSVEVTKLISEMPEIGMHIVKLHSNGFITYARVQTVKVHCGLKLSLYPFDSQNCTQYYVSWLYSGDEVAIFPKKPADSKFYKESTEWTLLSYEPRNQTTVYPISNTMSYDVYYDIVIKRKSFFYIGNFVLPTYAITALTIVGLFSPFNNLGERQEKVTMGLTSLLTLSFLLLMIQMEMPTTDDIPLLGLYEMMEMYLAALATVFAVGMMYLHHSLENGKEPKWFDRLMGEINENDKIAPSESDKWAEPRDPNKIFHTDIEKVDHRTHGKLHPDFALLEKATNNILKCMTDFKAKVSKDVALAEKMLKCRVMCYQTDKVLMVFFMIINTIMTFAFLLIGQLA